MKKGILILLLGSSVFANAQSLKDLLYSGKLKNEAGTVIRSSDDLSTKIDTTNKLSAVNAERTNDTAHAMDSSNKLNVQATAATATTATDSVLVAQNTDAAVIDATSGVTESAAVPKDNNTLWTEYVTEVTNTLKTEVMPSKKIKSGTYYAMFLYSIGTDGQVTIGDVLLTPENSFLQQQIKERFNVNAPQLIPVLSTSGTPRKVNKKYNFTLTK